MVLLYPVQFFFPNASQRNNLPRCVPYSTSNSTGESGYSLTDTGLWKGPPLIFPALHHCSDRQPGETGKLNRRRAGFWAMSLPQQNNSSRTKGRQTVGVYDEDLNLCNDKSNLFGILLYSIKIKSETHW